jgi:hypothetical protein
MTEDEIRELFRDMRELAVPPDSLARVRLGLDTRIRRRTRWNVAAWVAAAAAMLLAALLFHPAPVLRKPAGAPIAARQPNTPPAELPRPSPRLAIRPANHRVRRTEHPSGPVVIRIETPDPEVVILLLGE